MKAVNYREMETSRVNNSIERLRRELTTELEETHCRSMGILTSTCSDLQGQVTKLSSSVKQLERNQQKPSTAVSSPANGENEATANVTGDIVNSVTNGNDVQKEVVPPSGENTTGLSSNARLSSNPGHHSDTGISADPTATVHNSRGPSIAAVTEAILRHYSNSVRNIPNSIASQQNVGTGAGTRSTFTQAAREAGLLAQGDEDTTQAASRQELYRTTSLSATPFHQVSGKVQQQGLDLLESKISDLLQNPDGPPSPSTRDANQFQPSAQFTPATERYSNIQQGAAAPPPDLSAQLQMMQMICQLREELWMQSSLSRLNSAAGGNPGDGDDGNQPNGSRRNSSHSNNHNGNNHQDNPGNGSNGNGNQNNRNYGNQRNWKPVS